jgi:hypothetical protein
MSIRRVFVVIVSFLVMAIYIIPIIPLHSLRNFLPGYQALTIPDKRQVLEVLSDFSISVLIIISVSLLWKSGHNKIFYRLNRAGRFVSYIILILLAYLVLTRDYNSYGTGQWEYGWRSFIYNITKIVGNLIAFVSLIQYLKYKDKSNIFFVISFLIGFTFLGSRNQFLMFGIIYMYHILQKGTLLSFIKKGVILLPVFFAINSIKHLRSGVLKLDVSIISFFENFMSSTMINSYFQSSLNSGDWNIIYFRPVTGALLNLMPSLFLVKSALHRSNVVFHDILNGPDNHGIGFSFYAESIWMFGKMNILWIVICLGFTLRILFKNETFGLVVLAYVSWYFRSDFSGLLKNVVYSYILLRSFYTKLTC